MPEVPAPSQLHVLAVWLCMHFRMESAAGWQLSEQVSLCCHCQQVSTSTCTQGENRPLRCSFCHSGFPSRQGGSPQDKDLLSCFTCPFKWYQTILMPFFFFFKPTWLSGDLSCILVVFGIFWLFPFVSCENFSTYRYIFLVYLWGK